MNFQVNFHPKPQDLGVMQISNQKCKSIFRDCKVQGKVIYIDKILNCFLNIFDFFSSSFEYR